MRKGAAGMTATSVGNEQAAKVYRFLGRAYLQPPDRPFLEEVAAWCDGLLAQREELPEELTAALEALRGSLNDLSEERVRTIQEEFFRLLRGLSPRHSPPPPYESVYREGRLWGEAAAAVKRLYAHWGLAPDEERLGREPPDHLGLELKFMGFLCAPERKEGAHPKSQDVEEARRSFLEEHLNWVEAFHERVRAFDPDPFYEALLALTEAWLALHREHLRSSPPSS